MDLTTQIFKETRINGILFIRELFKNRNKVKSFKDTKDLYWLKFYTKRQPLTDINDQKLWKN